MSLSPCFIGVTYPPPNHVSIVVRGPICRDWFQDLEDDDEAGGDGGEREMTNTALERGSWTTMIRAALVSLEIRTTGCMRGPAFVTDLSKTHAQGLPREKSRDASQAPLDRTSKEMRGYHAEPEMDSGYMAFSFDIDDAKGRGKAKDPTIHRADAYESNDDFCTNSDPPRTPKDYGGSNLCSRSPNAVLCSLSSATLCLHGNNAAPHPAHHIQLTHDNTNTAFFAISKHGHCTNNNTLNQREATNAIDAKEKPLQKGPGPSGSDLHTMEKTFSHREATNMIDAQGEHLYFISGSAVLYMTPLREGYHTGSACGLRELRTPSDPSFSTSKFKTRDESLPYQPTPTDLSKTTLNSILRSPTGLSFEAVADSLLTFRFMQLMAATGDHKPNGVRLQICFLCDVLSKFNGMEGNGQSFHSQRHRGQDIRRALHDPRSCSASLRKYADCSRAHVLQRQQDKTWIADSAVARVRHTYHTAQMPILATPNKGAESSRAHHTPQTSALPSSKAGNPSRGHSNGVLGEFLESQTPSEVWRYTSRERSRQYTTATRQPSSASPWGSSKASLRAVHGRIHWTAALRQLLQILCLSYSQLAQQTATLTPKSRCFGAHCVCVYTRDEECEGGGDGGAGGAPRNLSLSSCYSLFHILSTMRLYHGERTIQQSMSRLHGSDMAMKLVLSTG